MHIGGAAKRSSSAHALTATDRMDENGMHTRMNLRMLGGGNDSAQRSNGDVSRPRLRGELEMTPFIIPKPKTAMTPSSDRKFPSSPSGTRPGMNSKLNTSTSSLQQHEKLESPLDTRSVRSPGPNFTTKHDLSQGSRTQTQPASPNLPTQVRMRFVTFNHDGSEEI